MLKVGITGGIGSGKSIVCKVFAALGIPTYEADSKAKELMDTDERIKARIRKEFGNDVYNKSGNLDRKKMAAVVFNNKAALEMLNSIVHPAVIKDADEWMEKHNEAPYTIREAAILFESGAGKGLDRIITVTAPEEVKIIRVMERDKRTKDEILSIIKNQSTDKERIKRSDFVIINDEKKLVLPQVLAIHEKLLAYKP